MIALTVGLLDAEVADVRRTDPLRVDRVLRQVAGSALHDRGAGGHGLAGEWCVRRLRLELRLAPDEPDTAAARRWADGIAGAVAGLVADGRDVVHYPHRGLAVADAVRSVAAGSLDRAWAWRQLGLLGPGDAPDAGWDLEPGADLATDPAAVLLAVVAREPATAVAAIADVAAGGGLPALNRVLGESGWLAAAAAVSPGAALSPPVATIETLLTARDPGLAVSAEARRARAVVAASRLLGAGLDAVRRGRVRPPAGSLAAWAVLGVAEVEPGRPALVPAVAAEVAGLVAATAPPSGEPVTRPARRPGSAMTQPPVAQAGQNPDAEPVAVTEPVPVTGGNDGAAPGGRPRPAAEPGPPGHEPAPRGEPEPPVRPAACLPPGLGLALAEPAETRAPAGDDGFAPRREAVTEWAGLTFLLNSAEAAAIPEDVDADPRFAARPLPWVLHQLGLRLVPVPADDPAVLALAGLGPDAPPPAGDRPNPAEEVALQAHAARWAGVTAEALAAAGAAETLWTLARRPGRIVADPGWLEVHLALDTVDVAVRRAGLDVDPGWVAWLGVVVRIRYA